jgi:hypothetical protein
MNQNPRSMPEQGMSDWNKIQADIEASYCYANCKTCYVEDCETRECEPESDSYTEFLFRLGTVLAKARRGQRC